MYNEIVKLNYLNSISKDSVRSAVESLFNKIEDTVEAPLDKEIATLSRSDVIDGIERSNYLSISTLRTEISHLTDYFKWYSKNIQEVKSDIKTITSSDINLTLSVKENIFKDVDELGASLVQFPPDEGYLHAPVCCLAWLGLELDEILNLKNEDIFLKGTHMFVKAPTKIIQVESKYIYDVLTKYGNTRQAIRTHYGDREVFADDIGYFIKRFLSEMSTRTGKRISEINVRRGLATANARLNSGVKRFNITTVLTSGRLYRIREIERTTGVVPMAVFINEFKTTKNRPIRDAMGLYEFYKMAYGD